MVQIQEQVRPGLPNIIGPLPGPRARAIIERDEKVVSPSYTRGYPLVAECGKGAMVEDVDGNRFLDFNAGIAVVATGHCHPRVVEEMVRLAEKLSEIAPGTVERKTSFGTSGAEAIEGSIKLARYTTGRDKIIA